MRKVTVSAMRRQLFPATQQNNQTFLHRVMLMLHLQKFGD